MVGRAGKNRFWWRADASHELCPGRGVRIPALTRSRESSYCSLINPMMARRPFRRHPRYRHLISRLIDRRFAGVTPAPEMLIRNATSLERTAASDMIQPAGCIPTTRILCRVDIAARFQILDRSDHIAHDILVRWSIPVAGRFRPRPAGRSGGRRCRGRIRNEPKAAW